MWLELDESYGNVPEECDKPGFEVVTRQGRGGMWFVRFTDVSGTWEVVSGSDIFLHFGFQSQTMTPMQWLF